MSFWQNAAVVNSRLSKFRVAVTSPPPPPSISRRLHVPVHDSDVDVAEVGDLGGEERPGSLVPCVDDLQYDVYIRDNLYPWIEKYCWCM